MSVLISIKRCHELSEFSVKQINPSRAAKRPRLALLGNGSRVEGLTVQMTERDIVMYFTYRGLS